MPLEKEQLIVSGKPLNPTLEGLLIQTLKAYLCPENQ
jgi:hypothetical protein